MTDDQYRFISVPLTETHHTAYFDCGDDKLDNWLNRFALEDQALGRSRTHVWLDEGECVVGYFTLLQSTIREDDEAAPILRRLRPKKFPATAELPGVLVGKFALDRSLQRKGLSYELLAEAYLLAYESVMLIGGTVLVIEPALGKDFLRDLYKDFGFMSFDDSRRMYLNFETFNMGTPITPSPPNSAN